MIVLSIISIATFFSYFTFSGYLDKVKLNAAAKQTVNQLRLAKEMARTMQQNILVVCEGNTLMLKNSSIKLPAGISFEPKKIFQFASSGNPVPGFSGSVSLRGKKSARKIIISSLGRIRIE